MGRMATKKPAMSPSDMPVQQFLDGVTGPRRAEAEELLALFTEVSGEEPVVWAGRIIGFGEYVSTAMTAGTAALPHATPSRRTTGSTPRT